MPVLRKFPDMKMSFDEFYSEHADFKIHSKHLFGAGDFCTNVHKKRVMTEQIVTGIIK